MFPKEPARRKRINGAGSFCIAGYIGFHPLMGWPGTHSSLALSGERGLKYPEIELIEIEHREESEGVLVACKQYASDGLMTGQKTFPD